MILWVMIAFLLDLALGDPPTWPHPVRRIGKAIERLEAVLRRRVDRRIRPPGTTPAPGTARPVEADRSAGALKAAGIVLTLSIVLSTAAVAALVRLLPGLLRDVGSVYLLYTALATRSLATESLAVLSAGSLEDRRKRLAWIVSRDTQTMDDHKIRTSLLETIAENAVDGVYAPLFYMLLGAIFGVPVECVMAYKAASTLDSMVGYKNSRYLHFGWASARLDDLLNWIPARFSMPWIWFFGAVMRGFGSPIFPLRAIRVFLRDRRKHESPNSALPISMFAGLLGVQVGGPTVYGGVLKPKATYGDAILEPDDRTIRRGILLMQGTALLIVLAGSALLEFILVNIG